MIDARVAAFCLWLLRSYWHITVILCFLMVVATSLLTRDYANALAEALLTESSDHPAWILNLERNTIRFLCHVTIYFVVVYGGIMASAMYASMRLRAADAMRGSN